jgi:hypothetical protein
MGRKLYIHQVEMNTNRLPIGAYGVTECRSLVDKFILANDAFALGLAHIAVPIAKPGYLHFVPRAVIKIICEDALHGSDGPRRVRSDQL